MRELQARTTIFLSGLLVALGIVLVIETTLAGGGAVGYLLGAMLALVGAFRVYLARRRA
jgi:hypothetical protein